MFDEIIIEKIKKAQDQLRGEEEKYIDGIKSNKDYATLKSIRNSIRSIKQELEGLYSVSQNIS